MLVLGNDLLLSACRLKMLMLAMLVLGNDLLLSAYRL